jgi:hypothetical protein
MWRLCGSFLLVAAAVTVAAPGCSKKDGGKKGGDSAKGDDLIVLEYAEIDILPGEDKQVQVKSGKAETADAPKEAGVTAKVEDGKLTVSAAKDAKEGTHQVTVKGGKAKEATLKVNVKKKAD